MMIAHRDSPPAVEFSRQGTTEHGPDVSMLARWCFGEEMDAARPNYEQGRFCLELFRRAIIMHDEEAWASIYHHYEPVVRNWVSEYRRGFHTPGRENYALLVHSTFAKLALALTPARMERLNRFTAVLHYLKRCARSAVCEEADEQRVRLREDALDTFEREEPDPADAILSRICAQGLWRMIWNELPEDQRILLVLTCECGLKPGEIVSHYHQRFPSVEKVYRVKHTALQRIRRNRRIQRYLKALRDP